MDNYSSHMEKLIIEEANWSTANKYPLFIMLQHSGTPLANAIKMYTKDEFSHACICFNTKMDPIYSFGTKQLKPLKFGFSVQRRNDPFYESFKASYAIYVMYVNKERYNEVIKKLQWFKDNDDKLGYSVLGLFTNALNIPHQFKNKYVCSQFVMDLIGEQQEISKDPSIWTPQDIVTLENITLVNKGDDFKKYNENITKNNLRHVRSYKFNSIKLAVNESSDEEYIDNIMNELYTETKLDEDKHFFKDRVGVKVDVVLSNPINVKKFNGIVNNFINRNIDKLTKSGPCDMIPFTDNDHKALFDLFGFNYTIDTRPKVTSPNDITNMIKEFSKLEGIKLTFFETNPSQVLLYYVIRYFTMHHDEKSLNAALSIYALCVYPLMFNKYFPHGVLEPFMVYTIDNLTNKFIIKRSKHLFGALTTSIKGSYETHEKKFPRGNDTDMISWVERIRNDQNSLFKKIMNEYMKNWKAGNAAKQTNELFDGDTPIVDEIENATVSVQNIVQRVLLPIVENGVDILRAEAAAKMSGVSVSDCRYFLTLIITAKNVDSVQSFVESILFLYLYEDKRTERDIRSQYFLAWAQSLFKKTNSKNKNINNINAILNTWADETGIYKKFAREASRINYKKAIFFYIILCIQKNV